MEQLWGRRQESSVGCAHWVTEAFSWLCKKRDFNAIKPTYVMQWPAHFLPRFETYFTNKTLVGKERKRKKETSRKGKETSRNFNRTRVGFNKAGKNDPWSWHIMKPGVEQTENWD